MDNASKYHIVGTRRRVGAIGNAESFETIIIATDDKKLTEEVVRHNWSSEWQDILFLKITKLD